MIQCPISNFFILSINNEFLCLVNLPIKVMISELQHPWKPYKRVLEQLEHSRVQIVF